jgi:TRAP-type mannitol/chloroaromatic compound transport system permease small subunit
LSSEDSAGRLDRLSALLGKGVSWLTLFMVIITCVVVIMRYAFDAGLIWLQESVTWMHAVVFMLGAAYTLEQEEHVRVDVFYRTMSATRRAWIDLVGVVIFLWPVTLFLAWKSIDFVFVSWDMREASMESGGLPFPLRPLVKTALLIMPLTVALQGMALFLRSLNKIRGS